MIYTGMDGDQKLLLKGNQSFYGKFFYRFIQLGIACGTNMSPFGVQIWQAERLRSRFVLNFVPKFLLILPNFCTHLP